MQGRGPGRRKYLRRPGANLTVPHGGEFRGNKAALPSKPCEACGLTMTWRRKWAKNWAEVKYCSEACRRAKGKRV